MKAKEPRISVRVTWELKQRLEATSKLIGADEPALVRNCIEALCSHVEKHGSISLPLALATVPIPVQYRTAIARDNALNDAPKSKCKP